MSLLKRNTLAVLATLAGLLAVSGAWAQTAGQPMRSQSQIVAGSGSGEPFLVDPGAKRVIVDVRQLKATDTCTITDPAGLPLDATKVVEYPAQHLDLNGTGDLLGNFQDVVTWEAPDPGEHMLTSAEEFVALVQIEGGGEMSFWFEGLRGNGSIAENHPFTLWVTLQDSAGAPVEGANIVADVRHLTKANGSKATLDKPWEETFAFQEEKPGVYFVTLVSGVPKDGVYNVSVTAEQGFLRRQASSSIHVWSGAAPPPRVQAKGAVPPLSSELATGEKAHASPGQVYYGPEDRADPLKPVVVFVHGFKSSTEIWDRPNGGFYHAALEANYRVASVGLYGDRNFMTNGELLSQALPAIAQFYDVKQVVVVAHSKGGVDVDAALMLMGAADYVKTVMTLGTPHLGTALADALDQLPGWLASDWQNEGQESMRVGDMGMFRSLVEDNPNNSRVDFRTFGAWGYDELDPFHAESIEFVYRDITGPLLKHLAGDNDGIVPYASSVRPFGTEIFHGKPDSRTEVNHAQIRKRNNYWHHIQAQLLTAYFDNTPSPPANVIAQLTPTTPETADVILNWENHSRFANTLRVERSVDGGDFTEIAVVPIIAYPVYADVGLSAGHTYAYRLRFAINDQWDSRYISDYSNVAAAVFASPIPTAPTNLLAVPTSPTSVRLTWVDTSNNESGFEIFRRENVAGAPYSFIGLVGANVTQRTDNGVTPARAYAYEIRAVNGPYASDFSNTATATPPPLPLLAPTNLDAVYDPTTNRATLTWTDNSGSEDGFELRRSYNGGVWSDVATVGPNVTAYETGTFPPESGYYQFRVRAFRGNEVSAWSNVVQVDVFPPGTEPLVAPSDLAGSYNRTTNRVTLTWSDNSSSEDGFRLQLSYGGTIWSDLYPATVGPNVTTYVTGTFPPQYGYYQFRVLTYRGSELSSWSNIAQVGVFP